MFLKDKVIVGSEKSQGSVRKETIAVSCTIKISVPNLRLSPLLLRTFQITRCERFSKSEKS